MTATPTGVPITRCDGVTTSRSGAMLAGSRPSPSHRAQWRGIARPSIRPPGRGPSAWGSTPAGISSSPPQAVIAQALELLPVDRHDRRRVHHGAVVAGQFVGPCEVTIPVGVNAGRVVDASAEAGAAHAHVAHALIDGLHVSGPSGLRVHVSSMHRVYTQCQAKGRIAELARLVHERDRLRAEVGA